jgi:glyceraldehyde 3-phosphate dehydrogenase
MSDNKMTKPVDVVLYGFGRIGRLLARLLIEKAGSGGKLMLRAIVIRSKGGNDLAKRASLLERDSVHGAFHGSIEIDAETNSIIANGNVIKVIDGAGPDKINYTDYGISDALVLDNTGVFRDREQLGLHLKSPGVAKVVLTAPSKGSDIPTIVSGVNYDLVHDDHRIYSAASCTTNAVCPALKVGDTRCWITRTLLQDLVLTRGGVLEGAG